LRLLRQVCCAVKTDELCQQESIIARSAQQDKHLEQLPYAYFCFNALLYQTLEELYMVAREDGYY